MVGQELAIYTLIVFIVKKHFLLCVKSSYFTMQTRTLSKTPTSNPNQIIVTMVWTINALRHTKINHTKNHQCAADQSLNDGSSIKFFECIVFHFNFNFFLFSLLFFRSFSVQDCLAMYMVSSALCLASPLSSGRTLQICLYMLHMAMQRNGAKLPTL